MDEEKITPEVLYGSSASAPATPLPIEETPEIPMDTVPPPAPMPSVSRGPGLSIFIALVLIGAGVFYFVSKRPVQTGGKNTANSVTPAPVKATPTPADPFASWKPATIAGISYKVPPDVVVPSCDVSGCVSQGTNLPGGTRLTVSPKTVTQPLSSFRGALITDVTGTAFTSRDATISGHTAIEFSGSFSGSTTGGYGFSEMHGFMIEVTPTVTLEINHFTPRGAVADFAKDDALFTQIISTLNFSSSSARPLTPERSDGERATGTQ